MARISLQTSLEGLDDLSLGLLSLAHSLHVGVESRTQENLRSARILLFTIRHIHPAVVRAGLLRFECDDSLVESIPDDSLADVDSCLRVEPHSRLRRSR